MMKKKTLKIMNKYNDLLDIYQHLASFLQQKYYK